MDANPAGSAPSPEAFPTNQELVRALDHWARRTDDVRDAVGSLPRFDRHGGAPPVGLYVDDRRAPWVELAGELRFSLLRVYSVTPRGIQLVGQIQVTASVAPADGGAKAQVRIHFYVHEKPGTREVETHEDLKREVVAQHEELVAEAAPRDGGFDPAFV